MTGAQILAVGGILSALVGTITGVFGCPHAITLACGIMFIGNIAAFVVERRRARPKISDKATARPYWRMLCVMLCDLADVGVVAANAEPDVRAPAYRWMP